MPKDDELGGGRGGRGGRGGGRGRGRGGSDYGKCCVFDLLLRVEMGYCSSVRFRLEQTSVVRVDCSVSEYKKLSAY